MPAMGCRSLSSVLLQHPTKQPLLSGGPYVASTHHVHNWMVRHCGSSRMGCCRCQHRARCLPPVHCHALSPDCPHTHQTRHHCPWRPRPFLARYPLAAPSRTARHCTASNRNHRGTTAPSTQYDQPAQAPRPTVAPLSHMLACAISITSTRTRLSQPAVLRRCAH